MYPLEKDITFRAASAGTREGFSKMIFQNYSKKLDRKSNALFIPIITVLCFLILLKGTSFKVLCIFIFAVYIQYEYAHAGSISSVKP